ncbi:MAG TPA: 50S ribosomal protein L24 [Nitrososphaeraceae archaeon]
MARINPKLIHVSKHIRDSSVAAHLNDSLHQQYHIRSLRVIKGDTVRVMRGEYGGIEGKVDSVNTITGTLAIEGIQREKIRGGNVKVRIHSSNVLITNLNLDDKRRQENLRTRLAKEKTKTHRKAKIRKGKKQLIKGRTK